MAGLPPCPPGFWSRSCTRYRPRCTRLRATVVFPERYGIELPDLLRVHFQGAAAADGEEAWGSPVRKENFFRSLVENIPYRDPSAVTERTVERDKW